MTRNIRLEKQAAFVSIGLACLIFLMPIFLLVFGIFKISPGIARASFFGTAISFFSNSPERNALLTFICFIFVLILLAALFLALGINQLKKTNHPPALPLVLSARILQGVAAIFLIFVFFVHLSSVFVLIWAGVTLALLIWQSVCWEENKRFIVSLLGYLLAQEELGIVGGQPALPALQDTQWHPDSALEFSGERSNAVLTYSEEEKEKGKKEPTRKKLSFENYQKAKKKKMLNQSAEESESSKKRKINIQAALLQKKEKSKPKITDHTPIYENVPGVTFDNDSTVNGTLTVDNAVFFHEKSDDSNKFDDTQLSKKLSKKAAEQSVSGTLEEPEEDDISETSLGIQIMELLGGQGKDMALVKEKLKELLDKDLIDSETYVSAVESLKKMNVW